MASLLFRHFKCLPRVMYCRNRVNGLFLSPSSPTSIMVSSSPFTSTNRNVHFWNRSKSAPILSPKDPSDVEIESLLQDDYILNPPKPRSTANLFITLFVIWCGLYGGSLAGQMFAHVSRDVTAEIDKADDW